MWADRWFRIGVLGTIVAALRCFTPVAGLVLAAVGLGPYVMWIDAVLVCALIVFGGILVAVEIRAFQVKT